MNNYLCFGDGVNEDVPYADKLFQIHEEVFITFPHPHLNYLRKGNISTVSQLFIETIYNWQKVT